MTLTDIARFRLLNQSIATHPFQNAHEVVNAMVAMQAQEFTMAKWAIGLRAEKLSNQLVEDSFNNGEILRTHVMRPTWHFVSPQDIRWLLELTSPRVHALSAFYYRRANLDAKIFIKTEKIFQKALASKNYLTRTTLQSILEKEKITAAGERLSYIMIHAELEGLICSGPREGKQFTYALMDERVPPVKKLHRNEALNKFVERYFATRGPATVQDFANWTGLTLTDAKKGAAALPSSFEKITVNKDEYYFLPTKWEENKKYITSFLMPDYDEYGMSYKNRSALQYTGSPIKGSTVYSHWLVIDGIIRGTWSKKETTKNVMVEPIITGTLSQKKMTEVKSACKRYEKFFQAK